MVRRYFMILFDYYKVKLKVLNGKETPRNG